MLLEANIAGTVIVPLIVASLTTCVFGRESWVNRIAFEASVIVMVVLIPYQHLMR